MYFYKIKMLYMLNRYKLFLNLILIISHNHFKILIFLLCLICTEKNTLLKSTLAMFIYIL